MGAKERLLSMYRKNMQKIKTQLDSPQTKSLVGSKKELEADLKDYQSKEDKILQMPQDQAEKSCQNEIDQMIKGTSPSYVDMLFFDYDHPFATATSSTTQPEIQVKRLFDTVSCAALSMETQLCLAQIPDDQVRDSALEHYAMAVYTCQENSQDPEELTNIKVKAAKEMADKFKNIAKANGVKINESTSLLPENRDKNCCCVIC